MSELLNAISVGGDIGIWIVLAMVYNFDKRMTAVEYKCGIKQL